MSRSAATRLMSEALQENLLVVRELIDSLAIPTAAIVPYVLVKTPWNTKRLFATYTNEREKHVFFSQTLPNCITRTQARSFIHVAIAWTITTADDSTDCDAPGFSAAQQGNDEHRQEIVIVTEVTKAMFDTWIAPITRFTNAPPLVGAFSELSGTVNRLLHDAQRAIDR